jgi:acetyl esterase/lipase
MKKTFFNFVFITIIALFVSGCQTLSDQQIADRDIHVPSTISPEAQQVLKVLNEKKPYARTFPNADADLEVWRKAQDAIEEGFVEASEKAIADNKVTVTEAKLGEVPVLDIRPENWTDNGKLLVYTHGGAYFAFSARSTLGSSAKMTRATGLRVISVDYTITPHANWDEIQQQVISVFEAILAEGYTMDDIAIYGDSAGGGLAALTVLNLRDRGMGMPAAAVLWAPWVDISIEGDTIHTLKNHDPMLSQGILEVGAKIFADGLDYTDSRVSPIFADFSKGFSPTLIQAGTKEIPLSNAVRFYQTLDLAGQDTTLDIYEGMWHVFQQNDVPEAEIAISKSAAFIHEHLGIK